MRNWPILLTAVAFALAVLATGCQPKVPELTEAQREAIVKEITQIVQKINDAANDHNAELIMSYYLKSDDLTYADNSKVYVGWDTVASMRKAWHQKHRDWSVPLKPPIRTRVLTPNTIVAVWECSISPIDIDVALTDIFVRDEGGEWKIVHEHESGESRKQPE